MRFRQGWGDPRRFIRYQLFGFLVKLLSPATHDYSPNLLEKKQVASVFWFSWCFLSSTHFLKCLLVWRAPKVSRAVDPC